MSLNVPIGEGKEAVPSYDSYQQTVEKDESGRLLRSSSILKRSSRQTRWRGHAVPEKTFCPGYVG